MTRQDKIDIEREFIRRGTAPAAPRRNAARTCSFAGTSDACPQEWAPDHIFCQPCLNRLWLSSRGAARLCPHCGHLLLSADAKIGCGRLSRSDGNDGCLRTVHRECLDAVQCPGRTGSYPYRTEEPTAE